MKSKHIAASIVGVGMVVGITIGAIFMPIFAISLAIIGFVTLGIIFSLDYSPPRRTVVQTIPAPTAAAPVVIVSPTPAAAGPVPAPPVTVVYTQPQPAVTVVTRERRDPLPSLCFAAAGGLLSVWAHSKPRHNCHHHHRHHRKHH